METTLTIARVPTSNALGAGRWHRNRHNDQTAWFARIAQAVRAAGIAGRCEVTGVRVDWGAAPMLAGPTRRARFADALALGLLRAGIETGPAGWPLTEEVGGTGAGTVWVSLREVGDVAG